MKTIAYIGGVQYPMRFDVAWGGVVSTNYCYQKAFQNDPDYRIVALPLPSISGAEDIVSFVDETQPDIIHVDNTDICGVMAQAGLPSPDVIGPMTRSPIKKYKDSWVCPYGEEWFYKAKVIRLNHFEERQAQERITLIDHGVDSEMLVPTKNKDRKIILWAGQRQRPAKNYGMWEEVQKTPPPKGFTYQTMSGYSVGEYWDALENVALVVNTSTNETFCSAAFEAMARGVPVVWMENLQGGRHEEAGTRVPYNAKGYAEGIMEVVENLEKKSLEAREYVEGHCTLGHMRASYVKAFES